MKHNALVTISTINGSWEVSLGKATRMFLAIFLIALVFGASIGAVVIYHFSDRIDTLELNKQELTNTVVSLNSTSEELQQKIQTQEFTLVKLRELEELVGSELDESENDLVIGAQEAINKTRQERLLNRINDAKISLAERRTLLHYVPSGFPLISKARISSPFGLRIHPITNKKAKHFGLDFVAPRGSNIIATADGIVEFSAYNRGGYGHLIRIAHSFGFTSLYAHLDKRLVKQGDVVTKGQVIGTLGNSGISTGPHLHYEVIFLRKNLNPKPFIAWRLDNYEQLFTKETNVAWDKVLDNIKHNLQLSGILQQPRTSIIPASAAPNEQVIKEN